MLSPETDTLQALKSRPHVQKWLGSDERTVHSLTSPECTGGPQFENPGQSSRSFTFNINCWWWHYWTFWNAGAFFLPPGLGVLFPVPGVCFPGGWGTLLSTPHTQSLLWPCSPSRGCVPCAHCPKPRVWQPAMHAEGVGSGGVARQHRCDSALVQAQPASWGVGWLTLRACTSCLPSLDQPVAQSHPVC